MWKNVYRLLGGRARLALFAAGTIALHWSAGTDWCARAVVGSKANVCRDGGAPSALDCGAGQWWDPTGNVPAVASGRRWRAIRQWIRYNVCAGRCTDRAVNCENGWWWT